MRTIFLLLALAITAPLAFAGSVHKSCELAPPALVSIGQCSVSAFADRGIQILVVAYSDTVGTVHVTAQNGGPTDSITYECVLDGTSHDCLRIVDTGGANAGVWTVTGRLAGANAAFFANATLHVDFLTL